MLLDYYLCHVEHLYSCISTGISSVCGHTCSGTSPLLVALPQMVAECPWGIGPPKLLSAPPPGLHTDYSGQPLPLFWDSHTRVPGQGTGPRKQTDCPAFILVLLPSGHRCNSCCSCGNQSSCYVSHTHHPSHFIQVILNLYFYAHL